MRAYLQLVRLPNVFTAMADILLGYLFTHARLAPWLPFVLLLAASSLIYLAGMVLNDVFDVAQDTRERPFRPIPSGRISAEAGARFGRRDVDGWRRAGVAGGLGGGDPRPALAGSLLGAAVLGYDAVLKRTWLGPLAMGACRTLNVLLGMSLAETSWLAVHYLVAAGIGTYIAGVTRFARTEARRSRRGHLALGLGVMLAGMALLAAAPRWATGAEWPEIQVPDRWYVFWGLLGLLIAWRCLRAVLDPQPALVQAAVKSSILSLIILDAAALVAAQPSLFWSFVVLSLLVPTLLLGRWTYST